LVAQQQVLSSDGDPFAEPAHIAEIRREVRALCATFPDDYWRELDRQEINQQGGYAGPAHAQMYVMGALLRHGSEAQKRTFLPAIARGELRLQAFAVTEPNAGSDTTRIEMAAVRDGEDYVISGRKIFISRVQHSDLMLLLARTAPRDERRPTAGLSLFLVDLREAGGQISLRPLRMMMRLASRDQAFATFSTVGMPSASSSPPNASATAAGSSNGRRATP
jgi:acyl-CoA dehydrogenase